jgi:hypothetical protein
MYSAPSSFDEPMLIDALARLRNTHTLLQVARTSAQTAGEGLSGARKTRCDELGELIADAIHHAHRLGFIVEGDLRAELYS